MVGMATESLLDVLRQDVMFLKAMNLIDYSLLTGVHTFRPVRKPVIRFDASSNYLRQKFAARNRVGKLAMTTLSVIASTHPHSRNTVYASVA